MGRMNEGFPVDISTDRPLITSRKLHPSNENVCFGCGMISGRYQTQGAFSRP